MHLNFCTRELSTWVQKFVNLLYYRALICTYICTSMLILRFFAKLHKFYIFRKILTKRIHFFKTSAKKKIVYLRSPVLSDENSKNDARIRRKISVCLYLYH